MQIFKILLASTVLLATSVSQNALAQGGNTLAQGGNTVAAKTVDQLTSITSIPPSLSVFDDGRVVALVPAPDSDGISTIFLHATTLRTGIGSSDVGLDRASVAGSQLAIIRRIGDRAVVQYIDSRLRSAGLLAYRGDAVSDSFSRATVLVSDVIATQADGSFSFDISSLLISDTADIVGTLQGTSSSVYTLSQSKSFVDKTTLKNFPNNVEIDSILTFEASKGRAEVPGPAGRQVSLEVHHSLVRLPGEGYVPRRLDPRIGGLASQLLDFNAPLGEPVVLDLANRFRLEKLDPQASRSRVKKPIVFYVDRDAPYPIRSALIDGASWWKKAFEAAGYIDAFDVRVLPADIDPMDIRYNIVNWVNRETRGWSYGQVITDPRSGEIIKGSVLLGSLRVRHDLLIFDALQIGDEKAKKAALDRIRQLAAHEVGHALGLVHNFAGSSQDRSSVMDYPAPRITLEGGELDVSDAYGSDIGVWDYFAIKWLYATDTNDGDLARNVLESAQNRQLAFVSDEDSRPLGAAHPDGSLWDDGENAVLELERMLDVRNRAIKRFDGNSVRTGTSYAQLRRAFVPIWLLHRYQVESAAKLIAGTYYEYGVISPERTPHSQPVEHDSQRRALGALLAALDVERLTVPADLSALLTSADQGNRDPQFDREVLKTAGPSVFDPLVAADVAAQLVLDTLLDQSRLTRAVIQNGYDGKLPGADTLIEALLMKVIAGTSTPIGRRIAYRAIMSVARLQDASDPEVAIIAKSSLSSLSRSLSRRNSRTSEGRWKHEVAQLLSNPDELRKRLGEISDTPIVPPGMPIG